MPQNASNSLTVVECGLNCSFKKTDFIVLQTPKIETGVKSQYKLIVANNYMVNGVFIRTCERR
jgi:hypothetical protein